MRILDGFREDIFGGFVKSIISKYLAGKGDSGVVGPNRAKREGVQRGKAGINGAHGAALAKIANRRSGARHRTRVFTTEAQRASEEDGDSFQKQILRPPPFPSVPLW
jgi:hypothetical protein